MGNHPWFHLVKIFEIELLSTHESSTPHFSSTAYGLISQQSFAQSSYPFNLGHFILELAALTPSVNLCPRRGNNAHLPTCSDFSTLLVKRTKSMLQM